MDFNLRPPPLHSQAMDFNVYAGGDGSSFTCTPPNGYFASQALRVGIIGREPMHSLPPPLPDHKVIGREIMKERIRDEILAAEMSERRVLEDEVRRELEMERILKRRIQMERTRLPLLSGTNATANHSNQMPQSFFPPFPHARGGPSRNFAQDPAEFTFRERSPSHLRQRKPMIVVEEPFLHHNSGRFFPSEQNKTSNFKLSGTKRKTRGESPFPEKKLWGCALCEVNTTCENGLKSHLEGKKHKAKEALLASNSISRKEPLLTSKKTSHPQPKKNGSPKGTSASGLKSKKQPLVMGASTLQTKGASASGPKIKKQPLMKGTSTLQMKSASAIGPKNKKQTPVKGASTLQTKGTLASGSKNKKQLPVKGASGGGPGMRFWCSVCKVKCNSENMLEIHRNGKKHKVFTEFIKEGNSFGNKKPAEARGFAKEEGDAGVEGVAKGELGIGDLS